jgi:putative ABC transport system permease protein
MKFLLLLLKGARRSKRRTVLTVLSVAIAVFLAVSLRAVLDGLNATAAASSSTRIVTVRSTSLIFSMPLSYADTIRSVTGVEDLTWATWFGGIYKDVNSTFANWAVDPESYLRVYPELQLTPEERRAFIEDRTGCIVGPDLARRLKFKVGDRITLQVGVPTYGTQDYEFTVRAIYRSGGAAVNNNSMMFHWQYLDERSLEPGHVGWYVIRVADPERATQIAMDIDSKFADSPYETRTETEQAFQSSFASMFGNLNLLLGSIALAVVITTLFVAANTMAMAVRERTTEIAVMRAVGFPAATIFALVAGEGLVMSLVGGAIGVSAARAVITPDLLVTSGMPAIDLTIGPGNIAVGIGLSAIIGVLAGVVPARVAARLKIVDALRRVA